MPFGNGRFNPNSDIVCCLFSFPHPCRLSYISYVLHQGYALICNRCRTPARNIHSNRQIGLFGPSLFPGTMASADSSHFDFLGVPCVRSHGISQCSFLVYPCDLRHGVTFVFWVRCFWPTRPSKAPWYHISIRRATILLSLLFTLRHRSTLCESLYSSSTTTPIGTFTLEQWHAHHTGKTKSSFF